MDMHVGTPALSVSEARELARMIEEFIRCNPKATNATIQDAIGIMSETYVEAQRMRYKGIFIDARETF